MTAFCPATMCPLFARDGSPWTGDQASQCERETCAWWQAYGASGCGGAVAASAQVMSADAGRYMLQLGPIRASRERTAPKTYDCPHADECQWQLEAGPDALCPPRLALSKGLDPKVVAW